MNDSTGCYRCARRERRAAATAYGLWWAAVHWLRLLVAGAVLACLAGLGALAAALWTFLAQSGMLVGGGKDSMPCWGAPAPAGGACYVYHQGWGPLVTSLWFVVVLWTLAAVLLAIQGRPRTV